MYLKSQNSNLKTNKGMTLLIAVGVMGILLFISFAVINITIKGTQFATSGRDSQFAFYAADAGLECALYWDSKFSPSKFATSTPGYPISCAGNTISAVNQTLQGTTTLARVGGGGDANSTSVFSFVMNTGSSPGTQCAVVTVTKWYSGNVLSTYIRSRGYNTCDTNNPRRIERGIEVTY